MLEASAGLATGAKTPIILRLQSVCNYRIPLHNHLIAFDCVPCTTIDPQKARSSKAYYGKEDMGARHRFKGTPLSKSKAISSVNRDIHCGHYLESGQAISAPIPPPFCTMVADLSLPSRPYRFAYGLRRKTLSSSFDQIRRKDSLTVLGPYIWNTTINSFIPSTRRQLVHRCWSTDVADSRVCTSCATVPYAASLISVYQVLG